MNNNKSTWIAWTMWLLGALFYCYVYFLRISPSMMVDDLAKHFMIQATLLGNLAAFFYYAYMPMQVPVGIIVDRYGIRGVLTLACALCAAGVYFFTSAETLHAAYLGRFIIGLGAAFGYVTVLKIAAIWLPANRFAIAAGATTALGMIAAMFADNLLARWVTNFGYHHVLYTSFAIGLFLAGFIFLIVRNNPKSTNVKTKRKPVSFREVLDGLKIMIKNPQMWIIGTIGLLLYLPASMYLDLWGVKHITTIYHVSSETAGRIISMTFAGWIIFSPLLGALSDKLEKRKMPLLLCSAGSLIIISIIFYMPGITLNELYVLFFIFGAFCGVHPLCFAISRENNPNNVSGTSVALTNTFIMTGGFFQPVVGYLLDHHSQHMTQNNMYSIGDYQYALAILPIALALSTIACFFVKETHCQLQENKTTPHELKTAPPLGAAGATS